MGRLSNKQRESFFADQDVEAIMEAVCNSIMKEASPKIRFAVVTGAIKHEIKALARVLFSLKEQEHIERDDSKPDTNHIGVDSVETQPKVSSSEGNNAGN